MTRPKIGLCLTGGGVTGAMYQIGVLAALEDLVPGLTATGFDVYVGVASGGSLAAALAGGAPVQRLYRTFLDPADDYFPLQRRHLLETDLDEWRRTIASAFAAIRHGSSSLFSKPPSPGHLWEQLDRFYDSLPAGLFTLDGYEHLLEDCFLRRGIPNSFGAMPHVLRIPAYDLDSGERVVFGGEGWADVPVARACAATLALPLFYSPVRIADRHFISGAVGAVAHVDVALAAGADLVIVVNPLVALRNEGGVPTGHGRRPSLRDKGMMWVYDQANRIAASRRFEERIGLLGDAASRVLVVAPRPEDATLFLANPASLKNRRVILEDAYRTAKPLLASLLAKDGFAERAGLTMSGATA